MDLIVRNARLRGADGLVDVGIAPGRIERIESRLAARGAREVDAAGGLTTPSFVEPHIHLDKALTADRAGESDGLLRGRHRAHARGQARLHGRGRRRPRAARAPPAFVGYRVTFVRSYVDADTLVALTALEGGLAARERCRSLANVELIAFPREGLFTDPGATALLARAMERGADVVGGMPFAEMADDDARRHIDFVFDLARRFDRDVQMHVDESDDPGARTLHYYAIKTIREGRQGRVTADHVTASPRTTTPTPRR